MNASEFFQIKVNKAKDFGFPDPIIINAETLTSRSRVIYTVEIQAMHIPDKGKTHTHHYSLKFSKFKKIGNDPFWEEIDLTSEGSFSIRDKVSIEKLAAYIKVNQSLLDIDVLSNDFTSVVLSNDKATINVLEQILKSNRNKEIIYDLFKEHYPDLEYKILTYKLIEKRKKALDEFMISINDTNKKERNYWQPFLKKNKWIFGLSFLKPIEDSRIDIWNTTDFLFKSIDGFVDIIEIKHPHHEFWEKDESRDYKRYRKFLLISDELRGCITQSTNYIYQLEKKISDPDWQQMNSCTAPVKPECTIVIGRSNDWGIEENTAFRLLNDSLHGIKIISFDHLFDRAERLLKLSEQDL